jgi:transcription elongation factor GreA
VVDAVDDGVAAVGSYLELDFGDGAAELFVLDDRADDAQALSPASPMGRAVLGTAAGDTVRWQAPAGELEAKVLRVFVK